MQLAVSGKAAYVYTANHTMDAARPTVVFIHGAGNDHAVWALQSRYFAYHGHNLLAVDLPGHGRSSGSPLASITEMADWIISLLAAAGIVRAALVGHSMGSLIALNTAGRYPDRVTKIALIGTVAPMPVSAALLETSQHKEHDAFDMINIWGHAPSSYLGGNTVPGMWMMGSAMRLLERNAPGTLHRDFAACNAYASGLEDAAAVRCPSLLILGARDQMTPPRRARDLQAKLSDSRSVLIEAAGHSLMAEAPDRVLDELIAFI